MFLVKSHKKLKYEVHNLTFSILRVTFKKLGINRNIYTKSKSSREGTEENGNLESLIAKVEPKILYNSTIERKRIKLGFKRNIAFVNKLERFNDRIQYALENIQPLPLSLKYLSDVTSTKKDEIQRSEDPNLVTQFPYIHNSSVNDKHENVVEEDEIISMGKAESIDREIRSRHELSKNIQNWMSAYDNFENDLLDDQKYEINEWKVNYGTPDPKSKISNVPCGGCGALLHCKDTGIPGYIPSEIFKNCWKKGAANLEAIICQRCYFLKEHNLALQVRVSPNDYPKVLTTIQGKKALVVLMVDLMDFPCSIWPGIADILGPRMPIVVVGNKIDLLPKDNTDYLNRIKQNLLIHIKMSGFATSNILHVGLMSAKTGFGIEDFITSLQSLWKSKGDVYLVGCTNVGKSTLFNALLQSDYCKIQAADLIQRATTSQWPGTTLNLLKFPIMRASGYRLYLRHHRMQFLQKVAAEESKVRSEQLKKFNNAKYATLIGHIGQTYSNVKEEGDETKDSFFLEGKSNASGKVKMGIDENHPDYVLGHWCYDTPGVVQPDQILHLLTVEELTDTLPRQVIRPETFCVKAGTSLFIAGLGRLDYLEGPGSIRLTVFRSNELPLTVCPLEQADDIYQECLGSELFKVPVNSGERLAKWPGLESSKPFTITGTDWKSSCQDVVLSSAGWVAINGGPEKQYTFQAWTPEKRGIYIRDCILPKAVLLRGARVRFSVAYKTHRFI